MTNNSPEASLSNSQRRALANRETPLIRNVWYVAAKKQEVSRELMARWILDRNIVFFRTQTGEPVALQNRCCHRSFPLSKSFLEQDTIVCGYHGLRYDTTGQCIEVPAQKREPSKQLKVKSYPVVDKGPFVWVWMGDADDADPSQIPFQSWMEHEQWVSAVGYLNIKGSYVHLHENLLDLSHLSFLHRDTFGTPEYIQAPTNVIVEGEDIQVWREVECELPSIYADPLQWKNVKALRSSGSQFVGPSLHINTGIFTRLDKQYQKGEYKPMVKVAQIITPESQYSTHYYFAVCRNFVLDDAAISDFMIEQQYAAFEEDRLAMEYIDEFESRDRDPDYREISLVTDKAALAMLRHLTALSEAEQMNANR